MFDPVTNMRVGVKVLRECIARAGLLEGGLRYYVGAANLEDTAPSCCVAEHAWPQQVAGGRRCLTLLAWPPWPQPLPVVAPA